MSSGNEWDLLRHIEENLGIGIPVTSTSLNYFADSHETDCPTASCMDGKLPLCLKKTSSKQRANNRLGSEGVRSNDTIKMDEPVAMRTRGSSILQHPSKAKCAKNISGKLQKDIEEKGLLQQLIQQNKQQQDRLTEMNVTLKKVLELQLSTVRELHEHIEAVMQSTEKTIPLPGPIMVKTSKATKESKADASNVSREPFEKLVTLGNHASTKSTFNEVMLKNIKTTMLPTSALDDSNASSCDRARVFVATPRKTTKNASDSLDDSNNYESTRLSDVSQVTDTSQDSMQSDTSPVLVRADRNQRSTRDKRERYTPPKKSKEVQDEALARIKTALNQVPPTTHFDPKGKKCEATLYIGNLEYMATKEQLHDSLHKYFKKIKIQEIVIPTSNGRSRGYAFVTLAWAEACNVKPSDICDYYSGVIDVNSRYIYLHELRSKNGNKSPSIRSLEKAHATVPAESTARVLRATAQSERSMQMIPMSSGGFHFC
jgi:hypothetical protein